MEKEFKTIAYIIENTNGQVVELNGGNYLYMSNEVITDIVRNNKDVYDDIFNEGVKTSEPIIEATKKDAEGMYKRIKELESQFNKAKDSIDNLNNIINNKEATISQCNRDINNIKEDINTIRNNINNYIALTDKIDIIAKDNIIKVINKEFESKFGNSIEPFNWDEYDESKYL